MRIIWRGSPKSSWSRHRLWGLLFRNYQTRSENSHGPFQRSRRFRGSVPTVSAQQVTRGRLNLPQYSPEHVAGPGAPADPAELTFPGCSCPPPSCRPGACACLHWGSENYDAEGRCLQALGTASAWARPVFECNALCPCGEDCGNRVAQRGLRAHLQLFRTQAKGWGLRTLDPIPQGHFVCEYAGEVLGAAEAQRRARAQRPDSCNYLIAVREHVHGGQVLETFVDPARVGNVGRFLNHSCEPNLLMVPVRVHSAVPRLALFAARDILPEEELSYDYSGRFLNPGGPHSQETPCAGQPRKPCHCGAPSCAAFLPFQGSLWGPVGQAEEDEGAQGPAPPHLQATSSPV